MKKLSHNIIFNLTGNAFVLLYGIMLLPIILSALGPESAGIIGLYTTIFAALVFFDLGLGILANRQISKRKQEDVDEFKLKELIITLEILYWLISFVISLLIFLLAPIIAEHILNASSFTKSELTLFVRIISVSIFFRWPVSFYFNANSGLQNLVGLNIIKIVVYSLLMVSLYVLIVLLNYNIGQYLIAITVMNALLVVSYALLFRRSFGFVKLSLFNIKALKGHIDYALGSMIISSLTLFFIQFDKLFLSYLGSLSDFGVYTVVFSLSIGIVQLIYPLTGAFFPKMNELLSSNKINELLIKVNYVSTLLIIIPFAFLTIFFSFKEEILDLWLDEYNTKEIQDVFLIMVVASTLYAMAQLPYLLESAMGEVKFVMKYFIVVNIIYILAMILFFQLFQLRGISSAYLLVMLFYFFGAVYLSFKNLGKKVTLIWLKNIFINILLVVSLIYFIRILKIDFKNMIFNIIEFGVAFIIACFVLLIYNKITRDFLNHKLFS